MNTLDEKLSKLEAVEKSDNLTNGDQGLDFAYLRPDVSSQCFRISSLTSAVVYKRETWMCLPSDWTPILMDGWRFAYVPTSHLSIEQGIGVNLCS